MLKKLTIALFGLFSLAASATAQDFPLTPLEWEPSSLNPPIELVAEPPSASYDSDQWWRWGYPKTANPAAPGSGDCDSNDVMTNGAANCPLLTGSNFGISGGVMTITGYYKLPNPPVDETLTFAGLAIVDGDSTKLWVNTSYFIGQYTIPTPVNNPSPATWNTASNVQVGTAYVNANGDSDDGKFYDEVDGETTNNAYLSGILDIGTYLIVGGLNYYPLGSYPDKALFRISRTFSEFSYPGAVRGWDGDGVVTHTQAFTSQYCGHVPGAWQTALGNIHFCGNAVSYPIVTRTSNGPSIIMHDLTQVNTTTVTGQGLLYYLGTDGSATMGAYAPSVVGTVWGATGAMAGCQMINLTRTMICLYEKGTGTDYGACYGDVPSPPGDCGIPMEDPEYNKISTYHAPPYTYMYMLYDLNKLKAVKDGTGGWTHENVAPYEYGAFTLSVSAFRHRLLGLAYDASTQRLHTIVLRTWGGIDRDFPAGIVIPVTIP